ncbi:MAG: L-lysine 6-transaminase [Candidatus Polarisedimenticolia bacterium]
MQTPDQAMETLKKYMLVDGFDVMIDFEKSRGNTVVDARTGRAHLDMFSMVASQPLGLNHPKMLEEGFERRIGRVAVHNTTNSDIYNADVAEFVDTFMTLAAPASMKHLFLVAGGSLGIENALKIAFDWKVRKNFKKGYKEEKGQQVLHFKECFHGRSGYTLSMTNTDPSKTKYFPKFDWPRIVNPKVSFPLEGQNLRDVEKVEAEALAQIKQALHDRRDDIAALIVEPIQGEGGDNHFRGEFLRALRQVCDESEVFFILDEVQTGVALTGKMWAYQHFGFEPDAIAFGKKTQVCGCMVSARVDEVENNCFVESSRINSTWGGNTVDMVRAARYFRIIHDDRLVQRVADMGGPALALLRGLQQELPGLFTNARGRGLFMAIDVVDPAQRPALMKQVWSDGLLILPSGSRTVRFRPSLITTLEEIRQAVEMLARAGRQVLGGKPATVAV